MTSSTTPSTRRMAATFAVGLTLLILGYLAWITWGPLLGDIAYPIASIPAGVGIGLGGILAAKRLMIGGTR